VWPSEQIPQNGVAPVSRSVEADCSHDTRQRTGACPSPARAGAMTGRPLPSPFAGRPRLLIADDDPLVRTMLVTALEDDFEVVGLACDGEQAVELARMSQPDAALVDVEMPMGGGLAAVRGIVEFAPGTAIVVLSIDEHDATVRLMMKAGAVAYRRKGNDPHSLARSLTDSIDALAAWQGEQA
jgi:CheY-like chemotaxis protein